MVFTLLPIFRLTFFKKLLLHIFVVGIMSLHQLFAIESFPALNFVVPYFYNLCMYFNQLNDLLDYSIVFPLSAKFLCKI